MAYERLPMRKIREILRLYYECKLSRNQIGLSCGISRTAVSDCLGRAMTAGLNWPIPENLNDEEIEKLLYKNDAKWKTQKAGHPEWAKIHTELRRAGVTRELLWQEYREQNPDGLGYSQFCTLYREWCKKSEVSLRQFHKAGEKLFVDYAGQTVPVFDPVSGEVRKAEIFVAVLGASNFTYVEASWDQSLSSWISSHTRAFEFFGGVPQIVVPDNLKSAVSQVCRYEPEINKTYNDLAIHYGFAVVPARPYKPKDKAKAEAAVLLVERWILAVLRNEKFYGLDELNLKIKKLLDVLANKPFQKIPGSRRSLFEEIEKKALKPLPETRYQYAEFKAARVNIDYHVEFEGHYYSVPYTLVRDEVDLRITSFTIEIFHKNKRVASHKRGGKKGHHTTIQEHMPKSHQKYLQWTPSRIINWAETIGPATAELAKQIMATRSHPEQGFRSCMGIFRLGKTYGNIRLEAASKRAIAIKSYAFRSVQSILERGLDQALADKEEKTHKTINHENIRGEEILH